MRPGEILDRLILSGKSCNLRMIRPMIRDKFRSSDRYIEGVTQIIFQPEYAKRATSVGACQAEEIRHSGYDPKSAVDRLRRGANYVHFDVDNLFFSLPLLVPAQRFQQRAGRRGLHLEPAVHST